jgi:tRNA(Arg) A34 adenosine deaminase TadA
MDINSIVNKLYEGAKLALESGQLPAKSILVNNFGDIVSTGNNQAASMQDPLAFAEIVCMREACHKLRTNNLKKTTLFTIFEPNTLILTSCYWAGIENIYYFISIEDLDIGIYESDFADFDIIQKFNKFINCECLPISFDSKEKFILMYEIWREKYSTT